MMGPTRRKWLAASSTFLFAATAIAVGAEGERTTVTLQDFMVCGIDAREPDRSYPLSMTVDAVHRATLLRFPRAAAEVETALRSGLAVERAEVVLDSDGYEINPPGYLVRVGLGEAKWKNDPPQWHLVAWVLRQPWVASSTIGPTFNAYINGAGYWKRYGAGDPAADRFEPRLGPIELSSANPVARLDVTGVFVSAAFGSDPVSRARVLAENGLLLRKLETYDSRYRDWSDPYEWAVPTGGHGLRFRNPRLVLTLAKDPAERGTTIAPASIDVVALARQLQSTHTGGAPTAALPTASDFARLAQAHVTRDLSPLPELRRQRIEELSRLGGGNAALWMRAVETGDYALYRKLIAEILATPPRYWRGWWFHDDFLVWSMYRDLLPEFVQDHIKSFWESWLMPDIPTSALFHPQAKENLAYWESSHDWRGRTSFFRDGYNYTLSTENFNHSAALGALLGGALVNSEYAMEDGRHGLENLPLRFWAFVDGSTQEMLDHYYFPVTLSGQKMFADLGPTVLDRLMGRIALDRSMELLATAYHPNLRRFVSASGRTNMQSVLARQDGVYDIVHTLSKRGALKYLGTPLNATMYGMQLWGDDTPPGRIAMQAVLGPWAPDWVGRTLDEKPFPFEETSTETAYGSFNPPLWRRIHLGHHYGLASQDIKDGTVDVIAQWNSRAEASDRLEDLGTLTVRYVVNNMDMSSTQGGVYPHPGGIATFQHRNRAIVFTKPRTEKERIVELAGKDGLKTLATVIALWNFRLDPQWEIHVDGRKVAGLPFSIHAGQVLTIRDGVTYLGIIPLHATDLGRKDEVVVAPGTFGKSEPNGALIRPALTITSYNLQREEPLAFDQADWPAIGTKAHGGFVIELGDDQEYASFKAFEDRMRSNALEETWSPEENLVQVRYRSGKDLLEAGYGTSYPQSSWAFGVDPGNQSKVFRFRRINGEWPYLPPGIDRDTTFAQQGTTGRLEKNGAILVTEPGRKAYLQTQPDAGIYTGYNPLPDPTPWTFSVPGGITIEARGKVSLLRASIQPPESNIWIDYATKAGQDGPGMATQLLVKGLRSRPNVELNGRVLCADEIEAVAQGAYAVPLQAAVAARDCSRRRKSS